MKRLLALALLVAGAAHAQTFPQVWGCNTNCNVTGNAFDGAWLPANPRPTYVAGTLSPNTNCATKWWNTSGAVRWRASSSLAATQCVASRRNATEDIFQSVATLWPAAPPPPPPPPQNPTAVVTVSAPAAWTYETLTVTWSSANAVSCTSTWSTPATVPTSGSATVGPFPFPQRVDLTVTCVNSAGVGVQGGAYVEIRGIAPDCYPDSREEFDAHVRWSVLSLANWSSGYQIVATWFCPGPNGPAQQTRAFGSESAARKARQFLDGVLTIDAIRNDCNVNCRAIPPGPLDDEMESFRHQFTVEQLGVIE